METRITTLPARAALIALVAWPLLLTASHAMAAAPTKRFHESVARQGATRADVSIEVGAAELSLVAADLASLAELDITHVAERAPRLKYTVSGGEGVCRISNSSDQEGNTWNLFGDSKQQEEDRWNLKLCRDLPMDLQVNFGMGSGEVDLGGMTLDNLEFTTGLSDVVLDFTRACKGGLKHAELATGLGKMEVHGLGNAPFRDLEFSGGLGSAVLDFSGSLRRDMTVTLDVGMGSLTLRIPKSFGIKVRHEDNLFSKSEFAGLEQVGENTWYSENWQDAKGNLTLILSVGMGSVKLERIP